jgi:hypothetical protein
MSHQRRRNAPTEVAMTRARWQPRRGVSLLALLAALACLVAASVLTFQLLLAGTLP